MAAFEFPAIVDLNVGGSLFTTSLSTLQHGDGMLANMFSGRHAVVTDRQGRYFIDRDGTHFRHVLNFLRDGAAPVALSRGDQAELRREAEFYGLQGLAATDTGLRELECSGRELAASCLEAKLKDPEARRAISQVKDEVEAAAREGQAEVRVKMGSEARQLAGLPRLPEDVLTRWLHHCGLKYGLSPQKKGCLPDPDRDGQLVLYSFFDCTIQLDDDSTPAGGRAVAVCDVTQFMTKEAQGDLARALVTVEAGSGRVPTRPDGVPPSPSGRTSA